jgi:hypothetical protein
MAIILPKPELKREGGGTESFFAALEAMREKMNSFESIQPAVVRNSHIVLRYSIKKIASLAGEKLGYRFEGQPSQRQKLDWDTSKAIILSNNFGMPKAEGYTRFVYLIKTHMRARNFSMAADFYGDIGLNYFDHMKKFLWLLEDLSGMDQRTRNSAMAGIRLSEKFVDRFIGQFIHNFFWTMFDFGHFPKNYYKLVGKK